MSFVVSLKLNTIKTLPLLLDPVLTDHVLPPSAGFKRGINLDSVAAV
jgi:hypothetical protein